MANPRKVIVHDDIGFRGLTFLIDGSTIVWSATAKNGSASAGLAVALVAGTTMTVELVTTNQSVLGRLDNVAQDGSCTVQIEGQCYLPQATGGDVVRGGKCVGGLGPSSARGYIKEPDTTSAASALPARHLVLDDTTATAISVFLSP